MSELPPKNDSKEPKVTNLAAAEGDACNAPEEEGLKEEPVHLKEGFIRLTNLQWEWPKVLPAWQRNAVGSLLHPISLCLPNHPLSLPGDEGVKLSVVTDRLGRKRICMTLKQVEYLQYYIHEMRLADPVWVMHLGRYNNAAEGEQIDLKDVGPPEYPPGEEWVKLPDAIDTMDQAVHVEEIVFPSAKAFSKLQYRHRRDNKRITVEKYVAHPPDEMDPYTAALVDNATPGPGLRRGVDKHRQGKEWKDKDELEESRRLEEEIKLGSQQTTKPTHLTEEQQEQMAKQRESTLLLRLNTAEPGTVAELEKLTISANGVKTPSELDSPSVASDSKEQLGDTPTAGENFTAQYYRHAQQALSIASLGGLFGAQRVQGAAQANGSDKLDLQTVPPIGRSLFMSIRLTTWDVDEKVVLEAGWSAIWWQEKLKVGEGEDRYEGMQEAGHIIVQDYLLEKHNGAWKPDERSNYLFGDSLPILRKDVKRIIEEKIRDLAERAGGGPTYILLHSADKDESALEKLDLNIKDWYTQFKPASWDYASYHCVDGIGKTFVIDMALLFAAAEFDPAIRPVPIRTERSLEEVATIIFGSDEARRPIHCGNAGNDAFYLLQLFLTIVTTSSLDELRATFQRYRDGPVAHPSEQGAEIGEKTSVDDSEGRISPGPESTHRESGEEDEWSDDDMIKGVFTTNDDGIEIQVA